MPQLVLLATALGFCGFGLAYALRPAGMAALTDLPLPTPSARADFMATYGGCQVGLGLFLVTCARNPSWQAAGLWAGTAVLAGLALARGLGILVGGGRVRATIWAGLAIELTGALLNAWALGTTTRGRDGLETTLRDFNHAFVEADSTALDTLLAPEYVHTNGGSGSILDREAWLAYIGDRRAELRGGRLRVDRYETSGVTIRRHPGSAVVSGRVVSRGTRDGVPFASRLRVTQVWVHFDGRWRRAAFHDSPIPDRSAEP
jgi:hypothetical protein